jgi:hypothetical protein
VISVKSMNARRILALLFDILIREFLWRGRHIEDESLYARRESHNDKVNIGTSILKAKKYFEYSVFCLSIFTLTKLSPHQAQSYL